MRIVYVRSTVSVKVWRFIVTLVGESYFESKTMVIFNIYSEFEL